jgi:AcrR family transcriptional regulator
LRARLREVKAEAILKAAEEVFAKEGILKAKMETIAARAGMAVGTLYNFFDDRSALVTALVEARSDGLSTELTTALDAAGDVPFAQQVQLYFDVSLAHVEQHGPFWVELLRAHGAHGKKHVTRSRTRERLFMVAQRVIDAGLEQKALKPEGAGVYAALLVGMMRSVLEHTAAGRACLIRPKPGEPERLSHTAQLLTDFFLRGALR